MAKFGYTCKCGWSLTRGDKTRKQYAEAKRDHVNGVSKSADAMHQPSPCKFLAAELGRTSRKAA